MYFNVFCIIIIFIYFHFMVLTEKYPQSLLCLTENLQ